MKLTISKRSCLLIVSLICAAGVYSLVGRADEGAGEPAYHEECPPVAVDLDFADVSDDDETDPGGQMIVNADDDDDDDVLDKDATGGVSGEDETETLSLSLTSPSPVSGTLTLSAVSGADKIRIWEESYKATEVTLPATFTVSSTTSFSETLYVEAISRSDGERDIELRLSVDTYPTCTDNVKITAYEIQFAVYPDEPMEADADEQATHGSAEVTYYDPATGEYLEVDDDSTVEWELAEGSGSVSPTSIGTYYGLAATNVATTTNPGDTYKVRGTLDGVIINDISYNYINVSLVSDTITVVPGKPADIAVAVSKLAYKSDDTDTVDVTATIKDQFGNLVVDGTDVSFMLDESDSPYDSAESTTVGGVAEATLRAPWDPVSQTIIVEAGEATGTTSVEVTRVAGALNVAPSFLDVYLNETATVTASVDAADGTPVVWLASNGSISGSSTVSGGEATATLSSADGRVGDVVVTATIGDRMLVWQGEYTSSAPLYLVTDNFVLTPNPIGTDPPEFVSTTNVAIHGPPNGLATVTAPAFVVLGGVNASNQLLLDGTGVGTFSVTATPAAIAGDDIVPFDVHVSVNPDDDEKLVITERGWLYTSWDAFGAFFGADPDTTTGTIANAAGGILIVGDVGALIKNAWRGTGFSNTPVNKAEVVLSGLGLGTEIAVGGGEIADVPISAARAIVARVGNSPLAKIIVKRLKSLIGAGKAVAPAEDAFMAALKNSTEFTDTINAVVKSDDLFEASVKAHNAVGDKFLEGLQQAATQVGIKASQRVAKAFAEFSDDALARFAALGDDAMKTATENMAKVLSKVDDPALMAKVVNNGDNLLTAGYDVAKLLDDMAAVKNIKGFEKLMKTLRTGNVQAKGFRYELEAAAKFTRDGHTVEALGGLVKTTAGNTDIDIIANGIYYQCKRSKTAFRSLQKAKEWVAKAKEAGGFSDYSKIKYVVPNLSEVPANIKTWFMTRGVEIITIPHP